MSQKEHSPEQKSKAVMEMLSGDRRTSEIASSYGVTPKTLNNWHREFLANAHRAFTATKDEKLAQKAQKEAEDREKALAEKVGQLVVELDWLKKKSEQAGLSTDKSNGRR